MKNDLSWRGMLIKDNEGDWGICVATWRGMKSGKPGVPGTKGHPGTPGVKGNPGHFAMKFVNLRDRSRKPVFVVLPREGRKYNFTIDTLKVNLKKGQVTVAPEEGDMVQHMALAFVTTTLYLLVQPRPKSLPKLTKRGDKKVRRIDYSFSVFSIPTLPTSCSPTLVEG